MRIFVVNLCLSSLVNPVSVNVRIFLGGGKTYKFGFGSSYFAFPSDTFLFNVRKGTEKIAGEIYLGGDFTGDLLL
jgi:hypothetical protein